MCLDLCVCDAILQMQMNEIRKMSVDRKRMPNECEYMMRQNGSKWGRTESNQSGLGVFTKGERENIGFICVTISYRIAFVRHTFLICLMVINLGFMPTNTHTRSTLRTNFGYSFDEICVRICIKRCLFNRRITDSFRNGKV